MPFILKFIYQKILNFILSRMHYFLLLTVLSIPDFKTKNLLLGQPSIFCGTHIFYEGKSECKFLRRVFLSSPSSLEDILGNYVQIQRS